MYQHASDSLRAFEGLCWETAVGMQQTEMRSVVRRVMDGGERA